MANDRLRHAITQAGLDPERLAELVEVDVKTVQRWLSGRTPYSRHRAKVARALSREEVEVWPEVEVEVESDEPEDPTEDRKEILAAFARASDPRVPSWLGLLSAASTQIDLLDFTLHDLLQTPRTLDLLAAKGAQGCAVRILVSDDAQYVSGYEDELDPDWRDATRWRKRRPSETVEPKPEIRHQIERRRILLGRFRDKKGVEVKEFEAQRFNTILRVDSQMLVTLHLWGTRNPDAPMLHLRRTKIDGLFDRFAQHFESLWRRPFPAMKARPEYDGPIYDELTELDRHMRPLTAEEYEGRLKQLDWQFEEEVEELRSGYDEEIATLRGRREDGRRLEERGLPYPEDEPAPGYD